MMLAHNLMAWIGARLRSNEGANLVEYAILVSLIAAVVIIAVTAVGKETLSNVFPVTSGL
jgi:Flp pilus assembly pilin Flp